MKHRGHKRSRYGDSYPDRERGRGVFRSWPGRDAGDRDIADDRGWHHHEGDDRDRHEGGREWHVQALDDRKRERHRHERDDGNEQFVRGPIGHETWRRGRVSGGFGSQHAAWSAGIGATPAGFGFGPPEDPFMRFSDADEWSMSGMRGAETHVSHEEGHRGRGPKGYRRSDERIREEVCEQLTDDWSVDATDITVEVKDGEVTLIGSVPSRAQKRSATECVEMVTGVRDVFNNLRVMPRTDESSLDDRAWRR